MAVADTARIARWPRWALLLTATVMGAALLLTAWSSYASVQEASRTLARGRGMALFAEVLRGLSPTRASQEDLAGLLETYKGEGLRFLAVGGRFPVAVGTAVGPPMDQLGPLPPGPDPFIVRDAGSRLRFIARPLPPRRMRRRGGGRWDGPGPPGPPPRDGARRPPPAMDDRPPDRFGEGPSGGPGAPPIVMELEPILSNQLIDRARRTAIASSVAAIALLAAAVAAFRWLLRRQQLEQALAREHHLATLGEMSAVLAHEIRNPLASLKGHAQLLAESLPEGQPQRTKAERVVSEAVRIESLTTGLLAFVRTGEIHRTRVDPREPLQRAAQEVDADQIVLEVSEAPELWSLDPDRMQQVLANLLRNAVQAAPDGTSVRARVWSEATLLRYRVRDEGPGIEPGQELAIFEPFRTSRVHGTGLGLAVAQRVVTLHGGTIAASNHPDGGAVFEVTIPRRES